MTANEVMAFYASEKLKQWMDYILHKPKGPRNKMLVGVAVDRFNYVVIPVSWKGRAELSYCPLFQASLN